MARRVIKEVISAIDIETATKTFLSSPQFTEFGIGGGWELLEKYPYICTPIVNPKVKKKFDTISYKQRNRRKWELIYVCKCKDQIFIPDPNSKQTAINAAKQLAAENSCEVTVEVETKLVSGEKIAAQITPILGTWEFKMFIEVE